MSSTNKSLYTTDLKHELISLNASRNYLLTIMEQLSEEVVSIEINTLHDSYIYEHEDSAMMIKGLLNHLKTELRKIESSILYTVEQHYGYGKTLNLG